MAKATRLISLNFRRSEELPSLGDFKAYLATDFEHRVPDFVALDHDAKWGDAVLDLVGKVDDGRLVAVFPSVSVHERDLHEVLATAMLSTSWLEDNRDEMERLYAGSGVDLDHPLWMILVVPALASLSRSMRRALERAGVEIMPYSIYDLATPDGLLSAVSFEPGPGVAQAPVRESVRSASVAAARMSVHVPHPPPAALRVEPVILAPAAHVEPLVASAPVPRVEPPVAPAPVVAPAPEPVRAERVRDAERSFMESVSDPAPPRRSASAVDAFVVSIGDPKLRGMAEQIVGFFQGRFPTAAGMVTDQSGFTLRTAKDHLVTVRLDRSSVWLEVGPERIPTSKIKDPATLERAMALPSVLEALHSVRS